MRILNKVLCSLAILGTVGFFNISQNKAYALRVVDETYEIPWTTRHTFGFSHKSPIDIVGDGVLMLTVVGDFGANNKYIQFEIEGRPFLLENICCGIFGLGIWLNDRENDDAFNSPLRDRYAHNGMVAQTSVVIPESILQQTFDSGRSMSFMMAVPSSVSRTWATFDANLKFEYFPIPEPASWVLLIISIICFSLVYSTVLGTFLFRKKESVAMLNENPTNENSTEYDNFIDNFDRDDN